MTTARASHWTNQRERGALLVMRFLKWVAMQVGRRPAHLFAWPMTLYFAATSSATRRASREYLARVRGRPARFGEVLRHVHTFVTLSLDRVFMLTRTHAFDVRLQRPAEVLELVRKRGTFMFVAHFGSFEVMRASAAFDDDLPLKIVLDLTIGQRFMSLLAECAPGFAANIIDSSRRGPAHVLALREALDAGHLVGMMVDRAHAGERTIPVRFLGEETQFPVGPWIAAAALRAPVVAAFGVHQGQDRYVVRFELLTAQLELPRENRDEALRAVVQDYADRLAAQARAAPYNWSNFYDFWSHSSAHD